MDLMTSIANFVPLWTVGPLVLVGVIAYAMAPTPRRRSEDARTPSMADGAMPQARAY
jgi:hypothetical protein